jgi:hypothetical protein
VIVNRTPFLSRRQLVLGATAAPTAALLAGCRDPGITPDLRPAARPVGRREREVQQVVAAMATSDGAGVKLSRALGSRALSMLDPFLMLDEFHTDKASDYLAGFPDHPHRGFETVTYMIHGAMEHRDSLGNRGRLGPGSVQWMTAGRGIIHSEMPKQQDGLMWGFQLWVNLPSRMKMIKPRYQDIDPARVAETHIDDAAVRVIAGEAGGRTGPVTDIVTAPQMLDVTVPARGTSRHTLPPGHNAFAYVFDGVVKLGASGTRVERGNIVVLGPGDQLTARSDEGGRFLLLAGQPIGEPVARQGPFVMNTDQEIRQAIDDYRSGRLVVQDG